MPVELPGEACARVKPELDRVGGHLLGHCRAEINVKIGDDEDAPADADIRLEAPVRNVGARQQGPPKHEQARQWNEVDVYSLPLSAERRRIRGEPNPRHPLEPVAQPTAIRDRGVERHGSLSPCWSKEGRELFDGHIGILAKACARVEIGEPLS